MLFSKRIFVLFNILKKLKFLRHTPFNLFAYSVERKKERILISKLENCLDLILNTLNKQNYKSGIDLIETFNHVRGFGHVKMNNFKKFEDLYEKQIYEFKRNSKKKELAAE